jgi:hypothetical protein
MVPFGIKPALVDGVCNGVALTMREGMRHENFCILDLLEPCYNLGYLSVKHLVYSAMTGYFYVTVLHCLAHTETLYLDLRQCWIATA